MSACSQPVHIVAGGTGLLGQSLVRRLLTTGARVVVPVRSLDHQSWNKRVRTLAATRAMNGVEFTRYEGEGARGSGTLADVIRLGGGAGCVWNCVADTRFNASVSEAVSSNIGLLARLVDAVEQARGMIVHFSTIYVGPVLHAGSQSAARNSYESTKAAAEMLLRLQGGAAGLRCLVIRLPILLSGSALGSVVTSSPIARVAQVLSQGIVLGERERLRTVSAHEGQRRRSAGRDRWRFRFAIPRDMVLHMLTAGRAAGASIEEWERVMKGAAKTTTVNMLNRNPPPLRSALATLAHAIGANLEFIDRRDIDDGKFVAVAIGGEWMEQASRFVSRGLAPYQDYMVKALRTDLLDGRHVRIGAGKLTRDIHTTACAGRAGCPDPGREPRSVVGTERAE